MDEYLDIYKHYILDTKDHVLTIIKEDGVYRHIRWGRPGSSNCEVEVITWPGYLAVVGDMGSFVFSRVFDMFTFFRAREADEINPHYWAEKVQAEDKHGGVELFSVKRFREVVLQQVRDYFEIEDDDEIPEEFLEEVSSLLEAEDEYECLNAVSDFKSDKIDFSDILWFEVKDYNYRYIWLCFAIVDIIAIYDKQQIDKK